MALASCQRVALRRAVMLGQVRITNATVQNRTMAKLTIDNYTVKPMPKPWNYLWKPGPYPVTQEARDAAAKKYVSSFWKVNTRTAHSHSTHLLIPGFNSRGLRALSR